ncbi:hypothetical protein SLE2022_363370 [Rubroshorea leprosula]
MEKSDAVVDQSPLVSPPTPPPLPGPATTSYYRQGLMMNGLPLRGHCCVSKATRNLWDELFDTGYRADVVVKTDDGGVIFAHANVLGMASPVLNGLLKQSKGLGRRKSFSIRGVPRDAVRVFIRFLYSSCYEEEELREFVLHLLVLSHSYVVPQLKRLCEQQLEQGLLTIENVVDVFQLALLCNAPRLSLICHRMILRNFKAVITTDGWKVMKQSHPALEKKLLNSIVDEQNWKKVRIRKMNERKVYLQLYEAMEALVHICRDGCRTIGPHDKDFKDNQAPCMYAACKGIESLVRHFARCNMRVSGSCIHCKRMWQLLELHSRLCADSDNCRVPLCRNLGEKIRRQSKKDEIKWKILVRKISRTKRIVGGPFFLSMNSSS